MTDSPNTEINTHTRRPLYQYLGFAVVGVILLTLAGKIVVGLFSPVDPPASTFLPASVLISQPGAEWSPSFSPDGAQFSFSHAADNSYDMFIVSGSNGAPMPVADSDHDEIFGRWSPDNSKIAFLSDDGGAVDLFSVSPAGTKEAMPIDTNLLAGRDVSLIGLLGAHPWSPDGANILYSKQLPSGAVAVFSKVMGTEEAVQITRPDEGTKDLFATRSADGNLFGFTRETEATCSLIIRAAQGGRDYEMLKDPFHDHGPVFTADNERIVFFSNRSGSLKLWEIDIETQSLTLLTEGAGSDFLPVIGPNGQIAYVHDPHETEINAMGSDESDIYVLETAE